MHPLRIGLHSEEVYIGDMGEPGRVEFTVIGNGVNFAQRLETACEPYRIQIGPTMRERLTVLPVDTPEIHKRYIKIKHHEELVESFELNPFLRTPSRLEAGMRAYQESAGLTRIEPRWPVEMATDLLLRSPVGEGVPINFSLGGMAVQLDMYLGKGVLLKLELDTADGTLAGYFRSHALSPITAEVRWGLPIAGGKYVHGLQYQALSMEQREVLLSGLRQACESSSTQSRPRRVGSSSR